MENRSRKKIIISIIIFLIILTIGGSLALYNYVLIGSDNSRLIVGDIYLRYINGNSKNITMIPRDTYNENDYFEFEVKGKNTSSKDIVYDIVLNHGEELNSPYIRLEDRFLRFRLIKIENNEETEIFDDESYDNINNTRIHVEKIESGSNEEINTRYRLYIWVNGVIVGNVNQNYTSEEWVNVYTNINVSVTGDFEAKEMLDKVEVTFDARGGTTPITSKKVTINSTYNNLPTPTKEGYTFLGWKQLPEEYQEVEYIRFNSGNYIDTGIIPTNHTTEIKFDYETYTKDEFLLGTSKGSGYYYTSSYNNKYAFGHDGNKSWTSYGSWTTGDHHLIYNGENNSIILDDELLESGYGISSTTNLWIGKRGSDANFAGKIYYVKITDKTNNTIVRNMIPCYRVNDKITGLYDTINDVFYKNNGSDNDQELLFGKGSEVGYITSSSQVIKTEEHKLYAIWGHNPTVTFDAKGGTVSEGSRTLTYNTSTYENLPTPSKDGYTFLGWKENNLPSEYQEVDYIRFESGSFIDTDLIPTNHTTEIKFDYETYTDDEFLLGTSKGMYYYFTSGYSNKYIFGHDGNKSWTSYGSWTTGDHHLIYNGNDNAIILDGELLEYSYGISSTTNLWIGKRDSANFAGKIYYVKITDKTTNTLVRNMIPCYRTKDNEVGLYDTVNGVFYKNNGSSKLSKGNDVDYMNSSSKVVSDENHSIYAIWGHNPTVTFNANGGSVSINFKTYNYYDATYTDLPTPTRDGYTFLGWVNYLPSEYHEVEYITGDGTQYINTNYPLWKDKNWKMEYKFDVSQFYNYNNMLGLNDITDTDNEIWIDSGTGYYVRVGGISKTKIFSLQLNTPYIVLHDNTGSNLLNYVNGSLVKTLSRANTSTNYTLSFGHRGGGKYLKGNIYYLKFWSNGQIVRNMIPCYKVEGNVEISGLYDLVDNKFYESDGTNGYTHGADANNYIANASNYIISTTRITNKEDHTLYAIWKED